MRKGKIFGVLALSAMLIMSGMILTSCDGGGDSGSDKTYELKLSSAYPEDHADTIAAQAAADEIEKKTDGKVKIKVFPANQLGDYSQVYEEVMKGTVDMMVATVPTNFDKRLEMLTIPYLTTSYAQAKKVYGPDSFFYEELNTIQNESDVQLINLFFDGYMGIGSTKAISNPMSITAKHSELMRVPAMDSYIWTAKAMGFNTTTIAYADLYSALQTGVADGWIGGSAYVNNESFGDVIKYYCDSKYIMELVPVIMNKDLYDGMPEEYQKIIMDAFATQATQVADNREQLDADAMKKMEDRGIKVVVPTDEELQKMAEHFKKDVFPKYSKYIDEDVMNKIVSNAEEYAE